jgi:hypothetical protein
MKFERPEIVNKSIDFLIDYDNYTPYQNAFNDIITYIETLEESVDAIIIQGES